MFKRFSSRRGTGSGDRMSGYDVKHQAEPSFERKSPPKPREHGQSTIEKNSKRQEITGFHRNDVQQTAASLQLNKDDVIIAVMGVTGTGKSTFINLITGGGVRVGHELESCTTDVGVHALQYAPGKRIFLIDTPGFDDTHRSDTEVLKEIACFLGATYSREIKLAGIIYLHPITDVRLKGSALKNLNMFQALCGTTSLAHVVLATTKWDELQRSGAESDGWDREQQLRNKYEYWGGMLENGSKLFRHVNTQASAMTIINHIMSIRGEMVLDIQTQMIVEGKSLDETAAGQKLQRELIAQRLKYEAELKEVRQSLDAAIEKGDKRLTEFMERSSREAAARLKQAEQERKDLRISHEKLQAEGEARAQRRVDELMKSVQEYQKEAAGRQALLAQLEKQLQEMQRLKDRPNIFQGTAAARKAEHEQHLTKMAELEEERLKYNAAIAGQQRTSSAISLIQGLAGLGTMALGFYAGMNPYIVSTGASMLGNAAYNAGGGR